MKISLNIVLLLISLNSFAQNNRIYGSIIDSISGEVLVGANVLEINSKRGTITDNEGNYSFSWKEDEVKIRFSFVGYNDFIIAFKGHIDTLLTVHLVPGKTLEEVNIVASDFNLGKFKLNTDKLKSIPSLGGENDLFKVLHFLPGISVGEEGSSDLYVRGGGPGENLVLLDNVPLYYVNHIGGFVSIFNPEIINDVTAYTGNFPAEFGGRLSSVIDVTTKDGNIEKTSGSFSTGLISSKISLNGPMNDKKATYLLSARRTYLDIFLRPFFKVVSPEYHTSYNFYDINAKLNYHLNDRNAIQLMVYTGDDKLKFKYNEKGKDNFAEHKNKWGNSFLSLQIRSFIGNKYHGVNQLILSSYRLHSTQAFYFKEPEESESFHFFYSGLKDLAFRSDWSIDINFFWKIKTGTHLFSHSFAPSLGGISLPGKSNLYTHTSKEVNFYAENSFLIFNSLNIKVGGRYISYFNQDTTWNKIEPRMSLLFQPTNKWSVMTSYCIMNQFIHQLASTGNWMNPEIWIPVSKALSPSLSRIISVGSGYTYSPEYKIQFEIYYRKMENLIEYRESELYLNGSANWIKKIESNGKGTSAGIDIIVSKTKGKLQANISYSYSRAFRQFLMINEGVQYPFSYDRPHNVNIDVSHAINDRIKLSLSWVFMSGKPITLPIGFRDALSGFDNGNPIYDYSFVYSKRNEHRMKPYHRLDFGLNYIPKKRKRNSNWGFSVYNAYNRQNPYYYYLEISNDKVILKQKSFFPFIPSLSYSVLF